MIALLLYATALASPLQDYDNPAFKAWSRCKVGAWVKFKFEAQGLQKVDGELTNKLLEVGAEKIVVEQTGTMTANGKDTTLPAGKQELKPKEPKWGPIDKEGDEEIEVAGRKLNCHWIVVTLESDGRKGTSKFWFNKDVPGGMVKTESALGIVKTKLVALDWAAE